MKSESADPFLVAVFPQICSYVQSFFTRAAVAFCSKVCTSEIKLSWHLPRCTRLGLSSFSNTADASEEPGVQAHSLEAGPGPDDVLSAVEMVTASHTLGNAFPLVSPRETGPWKPFNRKILIDSQDLHFRRSCQVHCDPFISKRAKPRPRDFPKVTWLSQVWMTQP